MHVTALIDSLTVLALRDRNGWCGICFDLTTIRQMLSIMARHTWTQDKQGFVDYCQGQLGGDNGDMMCEILFELYAELGVQHNNVHPNDPITWDDFEDQFLNWTPERALINSTKRTKWSPLS